MQEGACGGVINLKQLSVQPSAIDCIACACVHNLQS